MNRQQLRQFISKDIAGIEQASCMFCEDGDADAVHRMRVAYKRLRALLRLVSSAGDGNKPFIPGELKSIYAHAGTLRDLQIFVSYIGAVHTKDAACMRRLTRQISRNRKRLRLELTNLDFKGLANSLHICDERISGRQVVRFVKRSVKQILSVVGREMTDKDIHDVRKCLKDIAYNIALFRRRCHFFPILFIEKEEDLVAFNDLLGKYQDRVSIIRNLNKQLTYKADEDEKNLMRKMLDMCTAEKEVLKRDIIHKLSSP